MSDNPPETTPEKIKQIRSILKRSLSDGGTPSTLHPGQVGTLLPRRLSFSDFSDFSDYDPSEFPKCDCITRGENQPDTLYTKLNTTPFTSDSESESGRIWIFHCVSQNIF